MPVVKEVSVVKINDENLGKNTPVVVAIGTVINFELSFKNSLSEADEFVAILTPTPIPGGTSPSTETPPLLKLNLVPQGWQPEAGVDPLYQAATCSTPNYDGDPNYQNTLACTYTVVEGYRVFKRGVENWPNYLDYIDAQEPTFLGLNYYLKNKIDLPPEQNKVLGLDPGLMIQQIAPTGGTGTPTYEGYLLEIDAVRPQIEFIEFIPPTVAADTLKPKAPDGYYHLNKDESLLLRAHFSESMQTPTAVDPVGTLNIGIKDNNVSPTPHDVFALPCNLATPNEVSDPQKHSIYACTKEVTNLGSSHS